MERVAGDVYEMEAPQDATPERIRPMCLSMAEQLAAIHTVDLQATGLDRLDDGRNHLARELDRWADEMHRVQRGPLPALERLLKGLRKIKPEPSSTVALVHGDAKPGNFAFVGDEVNAVFDWEMTTVGDPLTDIGWMELLWMQPVGITSHPAAPTIDEFLARYETVSGITTRNRQWYRALNAFKMAVICLIGSMLFDDGATDDQRFLLNAHGISLLTQVGLADLGIDDRPEDGPVMPRAERIQQARSAQPLLEQSN
jgi:aminoglycoside phosphotransferase (APT) family kinase protein